MDPNRIARVLAEEMTRSGLRPRLFVQVNTGEEQQKAGVAPGEAEAFVALCRDTFGLKIDGLMCIPPFDQDPAPHFALLAKLADRLTVVRSFQTKHPEHNGAHKQLMTADLTVQDGKPITEPGLGAVYARAAGAMNPKTGFPRHALLPPTTRNSKGRAGFNGSFESVVEGAQPAHLGTAFTPFEVLAPLSDGLNEQKKRPNNKKKNDGSHLHQ